MPALKSQTIDFPDQPEKYEIGNRKFTEEQIENISALAIHLRKIRARLISEGYNIEELKKEFVI